MHFFTMLICISCLSFQAIAAQDTALESAKWQLQEINGTPAIHEDVKISFDSAQKTVQAEGGCNNFGGAYWTSSQKIKIADALSAYKTCDEYKVMQLEDQFFVALAYVEEYAIMGDTLEFYNKNGNKIATFKSMGE
jgi:heat shock protein HslJ